MAVVNTQFSTVTVHSGHLDIAGDPASTASPEARNGWLKLLSNARKRQQANAAARMELMSHGIDPDRFLSHHRG